MKHQPMRNSEFRGVYRGGPVPGVDLTRRKALVLGLDPYGRSSEGWPEYVWAQFDDYREVPDYANGWHKFLRSDFHLQVLNPDTYEFEDVHEELGASSPG